MSRPVRYKIADTETAGFAGPDEKGTGVCEVGWIEIDADTNELGRFSSLTNPGRMIEEGAFEAHGISDAMVVYSPHLSTIYEANWDDSPTVLIAFNKQFDLKFLAPHIKLLSGSLCLLAAARQYIKGPPNHKLQTLAEYLGLEKGEAHRALGDCVTSLGLLRHIISVTGRTLPELVKLDSKPKVLTEMPFGMHRGKAFHDLPAGYLNWIMSVADDMPPDVVLSTKTALAMR